MILKYILRSLRSRLWEALSLAATVFLCLVLLLAIHSTIAQRQAELDGVYQNTEIACVVTDATGSTRNGLSIPAEYLSLFREGGALYDHVKGLVCHATASFLLLGEERIPLHLLNTPDAVPLFAETPITYLDGYGDADLVGEDAVAIISENLMPYIAADGSLTLSLPPRGERSIVVRVIGAYSSDTSAIYLSLDAGRKLLEGSVNKVTPSALSFCVADNRKLNETKMALGEYFIAADPINQGSSRFGLWMDDASFVDTVMVLERSIALFVLFRTVLWVLALCVCFLVIFLLIRRRRTELAVMYSMGCSSVLLYGQVLCEVAICFAIGALVALFAAAAAKVSVGGEAVRVVGILLGGCLIGGVGSVTAVTSGDIMKILKGKE
ncbi:MAG: hypothetical protein IJW99_09010 [Clostridia bacterium]|nr:hypothetical protein [Clostridia bacterium]